MNSKEILKMYPTHRDLPDLRQMSSPEMDKVLEMISDGQRAFAPGRGWMPKKLADNLMKQKAEESTQKTSKKI